MWTGVALLSLGSAMAREARSPHTELERLQEAHEARNQDFAAEETALERDTVNRLIITLVRTEQGFQDEGDLVGVLQTRQLQEDLLETQRFPEPESGHVPGLRDLLQTIREDMLAKKQEIHARRDAHALDYAERLEPLMRNLTRAGDFESARNLLTLRNEIFERLNIQQDARPTHRSPEQLRASNDLNVFPLLLEAEGMLAAQAAWGNRHPQLTFQPRAEGSLDTAAQGFHFQGGRLTIPPHASEALLFQVGQTQSFTLELGFMIRNVQVAPILMFGPTPEESNLAILQENQNLVLLLRTSDLAGQPVMNRVDLGPANEGRMQHLVLTYRPGDLAVFRNGSNIRRNRADASGELRHWEMHPVHFAQTPGQTGAAAWQGTVVNFYMTAIPASSRQVSTSFERFVSFIRSR